MTFTEIVEEHGFVAETYEVITSDGYILSLNRVRKPDLKKGAPVVYF